MSPEKFAALNEGGFLGYLEVAREVTRMLAQHPTMYRSTLEWCAAYVDHALGIETEKSSVVDTLLGIFQLDHPGRGMTGYEVQLDHTDTRRIIERELSRGGWIVEDGPGWYGRRFVRGWRWEQENDE